MNLRARSEPACPRLLPLIFRLRSLMPGFKQSNKRLSRSVGASRQTLCLPSMSQSVETSRIACKTLMLLIVVSAAVGCSRSDRISVAGTVARKDGSPLVGARVNFRAPDKGLNASGYTDQEGKFVLGTTKPGEGVLPGEYVVTVYEDRGSDDQRRRRTISPKYEAPGNSGLKFTVQSGENENCKFILDPP